MSLPSPIASDIGPTERLLTVDEVVQMSHAGVFAEHELIELIDGRLVAVSPEGDDHPGVIAELNHALTRLYSDEYRLRVQSTQYLNELNYRLPDLAVVVGRRYSRILPADTVLVVEVARSSLAYDTGRKMRDYAGAGVPVYWVVDLHRREVHVHGGPSPEGYRTKWVVGESGELEPPGAGGTLRVADVLPPT